MAFDETDLFNQVLDGEAFVTFPSRVQLSIFTGRGPETGSSMNSNRTEYCCNGSRPRALAFTLRRAPRMRHGACLVACPPMRWETIP